MRVLVIFESMYGNTARVAAAIGDRLQERGLETDLVPIDQAGPDKIAKANLLVVGGPTHMHGMSRDMTRRGAAKDTKNRYEHPTVTPGIRTWLHELPKGGGRPAVAFDTRIDASIALTGSAAKGIGHELIRHDFQLALPPQSFLVTKDNTLVEGETERAGDWAGAVVDALGVASR